MDVVQRGKPRRKEEDGRAGAICSGLAEEPACSNHNINLSKSKYE